MSEAQESPIQDGHSYYLELIGSTSVTAYRAIGDTIQWASRLCIGQGADIDSSVPRGLPRRLHHSECHPLPKDTTGDDLAKIAPDCIATLTSAWSLRFGNCRPIPLPSRVIGRGISFNLLLPNHEEARPRTLPVELKLAKRIVPNTEVHIGRSAVFRSDFHAILTNTFPTFTNEYDSEWGHDLLHSYGRRLLTALGFCSLIQATLGRAFDEKPPSDSPISWLPDYYSQIALHDRQLPQLEGRQPWELLYENIAGWQRTQKLIDSKTRTHRLDATSE